MVRAVWIFAFPALLEALKSDSTADSTESEVDKWQNTVQSDKHDVETAIDKMGNAALHFRRAARNDTHAMALAKNLVDDVRTHASQAAAQGKKRAMSDFVISLSALKNLHTTNTSKMKDAVRDAQHKSEHLDQLQKDEQRDARQRLRQARNAQQDEVRRGYREAREATRNLLRDRNSLMNAQRHAGEKENVYEREEDRNEHFAEGNQDRAEDQHERALGAIESIFERAEDYLEDEGQKDRQSALHARGHAIRTAYETVRKAAQEEAALPATIDLMEEPMDLAAKSKSGDQLGSLAAALKNMESSANQDYQTSSARRAHYVRQAKAHHETEEEAQNVLDSDRDELMDAIHSMEESSRFITNAAKNRTHAKAFAINLVEQAQSQAHDDMQDKMKSAMHDFENSVSAIKGASSESDVEHLRKVSRQKSEDLNKLEEEEARVAHARLNRKRDAQREELRRSYRRAHEAASNMLRDGNRLEKAQRRSGEKESVYEKQQLRNEMFAERSRDTAQAHQERARDAVEDIYEHAQDALRSSTRKQRDTANRARRQAMESAVSSATTALRQAKEQSNVTELLAQPAVGLSLCAAASLGLLALLVVRRTRPTPIAKPLLG